MVIYVDSSVLLAFVFAEDRAPPPSLWSEELVSSRLLLYEVWVRLNARPLAANVRRDVESALAAIHLVDLSPTVLQRALRPLPISVRTLDALHVATAQHLHTNRGPLRVATYDRRMADAAAALGLPLLDLP